MCGRFFLTTSPDEVRRAFGHQQALNYPARYNIAPTQPVLVVRAGPQAQLMRWGFIPAWVKDLSTLSLIINARVETVLDKPSFRNAVRRRRCLLPANGYYEWRRAGKAKVPFKIGAPGDALVGLAAIYEQWMGPGGEELDTVAILTTAAHGRLASIHDRMPLVLAPEHAEGWLTGGELQTREAMEHLEHHRLRELEAVAVFPRVNSVRNDGPELHEVDPEIMPV